MIASGCSSSRKSKLLDLPTHSSSNSYSISLNPQAEKTLTIKSADSSLSGYVTGLKSCGYPEKTSLRGNSRQIFVGLEKLKIHNQEYVDIAPHRFLSMQAEAESDGLPIDITTYSYKDQDCFFDFVLWVTIPKSDVLEDQAIKTSYEAQLGELRSNFKLYIGESLPTL